MATEEYMTSQEYSATIGGVAYLVTASVGTHVDYSTAKTFAGDVTVQGNLIADAITGPTTVTGNLTVTGDADVQGNDLSLGSNKSVVRGTGSPEGVVTAPIGCLYERTDGSGATALYLKQTGTGNTGWVTVGNPSWDGHTALSDVAYDDIVVSAAMVKESASPPAVVTTWLTNLVVPSFLTTGGEYLHFNFQLPHSYVPGTDLAWHVHFVNPSTIADTETVIFRFTFTGSTIWGVFPATVTADATFTNNAATRANMPAASLTGTTIKANCHLIAGGATITGTNYTLSSILHGRLERVAADTHAGAAYFISADAHIQKNRLGSENEYTG